MAFRGAGPILSSRSGNLGQAERWMSVIAGLGLTLAGARRGGFLRRALMSSAGLSLLTRGATGFCGVKAAATGQTSLRQGLTEQWERLRAEVGTSGVAEIDSMQAMYIAELQELHSAEAQFSRLVDGLSGRIGHDPLRNSLRGYAIELRSRLQDLERLLASHGADPREHPDQAMRALIAETYKMAQVSGPDIRDAALTASLQRIIHYKIAGYGTVAAYAKSLDLIDEAARFAEYADADKSIDQELSELATDTLNPAATRESQDRTAAGEPRAH